jgi:putative nucleotidyltransferase with HDIG domain
MKTAISSNLKSSDLFRGDLQLTSPPNIYFELQRTIANPDKSIADVAYIIEHDPALSIRMLKIVNSAFFGLSVPISSVNRAINIIGVQALQNLVLATVVIDRFSSLPGGLLTMHDFWARSVRCALLSKELCIYGNNKGDLDSIFICGLLHDIGQLVFYRRIPELARQIGLLIESGGNDEIESEYKILGFNHFQTGAELTQLWGLPEIIITTIAQHEYPDYTGNFAEAASIIRAANYLCKMDEENANPGRYCIAIAEDDLNSIIENVHSQFEVIFKLFYSS